MFPIRVERHIPAPPDRVFEVILDVDHYPAWNPFTPRWSIGTADVRVGPELDLDCQMTPTTLLRGEREVVLALDREARAFCMGTSRTRGRPGITSYRWQRCEPADDGGTHFVNYEQFHGPLGPVVWLLYKGRLKRAFDRYCEALEARVLALG